MGDPAGRFATGGTSGSVAGVAFRHVARQGDCFSSIAARHGLPPLALFDHPENGELKERRKSPYYLLPGDVVHVPDQEVAEIDVASDREHTFVATLPTAKLRLFLKDHDGAALGDRRYKLKMGTLEIDGRTDAAGKVEATIAADLGAADLLVWIDATGEAPDLVLPVRLGHLDPVDVASGWKARLAHLGFPCGSGDGLDRRARAALVAFQSKHGLSASGEPDDATRAKLTELHDEES